YKTSAKSGEKVTLGTNGQSASCVNYTVFVTADSSNVRGDVNGDGAMNAADLVLLEKWLLAVPGTRLPNWKAGDLCQDGIIDVYDLVQMRSEMTLQ
ncbi:MAG: dockerin type I repeat-containing protein, partial [Spirochaetales bacterium]|nr:dockerin type I repeat-containing protein [Spirochaetales bacterium]